MPENTNKVIQLKDSEGNDVSPVVNVGSIYDKNGQKVDNLLSYTVAGTDVTVPELEDVKTQIQNELNGTMDAATLGGSTKEQIVASVPAPDLSNVNAAQLGGQPPSYYAPLSSIPVLPGFSVQLLVDTVYNCNGTSYEFMSEGQIPENAFCVVYIANLSGASWIGSGNGSFIFTRGNTSNNALATGYVGSNGKKDLRVSFTQIGQSNSHGGYRKWINYGTEPIEEQELPRCGHSANLNGNVGIKVYALCLD